MSKKETTGLFRQYLQECCCYDSILSENNILHTQCFKFTHQLATISQVSSDGRWRHDPLRRFLVWGSGINFCIIDKAFIIIHWDAFFNIFQILGQVVGLLLTLVEREFIYVQAVIFREMIIMKSFAWLNIKYRLHYSMAFLACDD